jgi:hypothetical protein
MFIAGVEGVSSPIMEAESTPVKQILGVIELMVGRDRFDGGFG